VPTHHDPRHNLDGNLNGISQRREKKKRKDVVLGPPNPFVKSKWIHIGLWILLYSLLTPNAAIKHSRSTERCRSDRDLRDANVGPPPPCASEAIAVSRSRGGRALMGPVTKKSATGRVGGGGTRAWRPRQVQQTAEPRVLVVGRLRRTGGRRGEPNSGGRDLCGSR